MSEAPETIWLDASEWYECGPSPADSYGKVLGADDGDGCIEYRRADLCRLPPELAERFRRLVELDSVGAMQRFDAVLLLCDTIAWHESQEGK